MTIGMRTGMARRLVEAAGGKEEATVACWRLARVNGWRTQAGRAEAFIAAPPRRAPQRGTALHVGWHGEAIGALLHDGSAWRWEPAADGRATPVRAGASGRLVPFIESLLPEGWLERVPRPKSERERVSAGKRYTSNVTVSENPDDLRALPADTLEGRLEAYTNEGAFAVGYAGPAPSFDATPEDRVVPPLRIAEDAAGLGRPDQGAHEPLARRRVAAGP